MLSYRNKAIRQNLCLKSKHFKVLFHVLQDYGRTFRIINLNLTEWLSLSKNHVALKISLVQNAIVNLN